MERTNIQVETLRTMTPKHPRWNEFLERLNGTEGVNCRDGEKGVEWDCSSKSDRPFATAILSSIGGIDIPASFEYFNDHGGFCDCEILLNCGDLTPDDTPAETTEAV